MKTILTLISTLFYISYLSAQTYYYDVTKTFQENGYTYQCDVKRSTRVTLYNKENKLTNTKWTFKDTGEEPPFPYYFDDLEDDTWTKRKSYAIVNDAFSEEEKQRIKRAKLDICIYINSNTGKVIEVDFIFLATDPLATIPVSVYRKIEVELKKNIWFKPTPEGKKMNYLVRTWLQEIGETILPD